MEVEFSMSQVRHILNFLDKSRVDYNSKDEPAMVEAVEYVQNRFFKLLDSVYDECKKGI